MRVRKAFWSPRNALRLALVCAWIGIGGCGTTSEEPRLFFLGIDGASWKVIGSLIEQGELPNFKRLTSEGAYMPRFETMSSTHSPVVWTSVATGRTPSDHGVLEFTEKLPNGQLIPVTSNTRRVKAIWEVATEEGVSVGVIGWWATWPAERVAGYVISDHANPAFSEFLFEDGRYWTADRVRLEAMKRDFFPLDVAPVLAQHWIDKGGFDYRDFQARSGLNDEQVQLVRDAPWNERLTYSILKTFYSVDFPLFEVAKQLMHQRPTRLQMLYLRGPDPIQHYGWNLIEPEKFATKANLERDRGIVEGVYRYVDTFLGELLEELDSNTWLIVASDHGAEPAAGAEEAGFNERPGAHTRAAKGVLFIRGPHVQRGLVLERGDPQDLMPTMAWLLGLPIAYELVGTPLTEAFDPDFVERHRSARVVSYGPREAGESMPSAADEEMLKSLRSLGYIK